MNRGAWKTLIVDSGVREQFERGESYPGADEDHMDHMDHMEDMEDMDDHDGDDAQEEEHDDATEGDDGRGLAGS